MREETKYMVNVSDDTAFMAVIGKASYLNCRHAGDFFASVTENGRKRIVIDFSECTGMDSTFLGMIAGASLKLRKIDGEIILENLNERNMELVENLGINKLVKIIQDADNSNASESRQLPSQNAPTSIILNAHENLVQADKANQAKFEDVISFLKKEKH